MFGSQPDPVPGGPELLAVFGPTAVGKTSIAVEMARILRQGGKDSVGVNCDSIQVYEGLEVLSGAPTPGETAVLEHRLTSFVPVGDEFSAGQYGPLARNEIEIAIEAGRIPIVIGGTGLYLRAAISDLDLRPPVAAEIREGVEVELAEVGPAELFARLPGNLRTQVHPNDVKRIARFTELLRAGIDPAPNERNGGKLWSAPPRRPTLQIGIVADQEEIERRIEVRVEEMAARGVEQEVEAAVEAGASRTARSAIGFSEFLVGDLTGAKASQRSFARRQLTWMRKMSGVEVIERRGRTDREIAEEILGRFEWQQGDRTGANARLA